MFNWKNYRNELGVEIVSRFTTDLKTDSVFYTDSNGRELLKRVRNFRETYDYTDDEPVAGNYYPITARIVVKDEEQDITLVVLNDRAQGGSSLKDGDIEIMVSNRKKSHVCFLHTAHEKVILVLIKKSETELWL